MGCNHCLEPTCLAGLSGRRLLEGSDHRHRAPQRRRLHRLSVLHLELLLRRPAVQPRARRGRQVRHVPRPAGGRAGAGLRERVSGGRDPDRDRQHRPVARRGRSLRDAGRACPPSDGSLSTTRVTLPANLPPNASPRDATHVVPAEPHWPLVIMTVLTQLSVGAFATIWLLQLLGSGAHLGAAAIGSLLVGGLALAASTMHLGRPIHAYRAIRMWKRSWLSREVLMFGAFSNVAALYAGALWFGLPGSVAARRAHGALRHRRRDRQRLHLPRAGAAGLEHAVHAAAVHLHGGAARAALRGGHRRRRRAVAGAGGGGDGRGDCRGAGAAVPAAHRLGEPRAQRDGAAAVHRASPAPRLARLPAGGRRRHDAAARRQPRRPARARERARDGRRRSRWPWAARFSAATCSSSAWCRVRWPLPIFRPRGRPHDAEADARTRHARRTLPYGNDPVAGYMSAQKVPDKWVATTCGYCSVGCGMFIGVKDGRAVSVRGNPDHKVNRGLLCPKGLSEHHTIRTDNRALYPMLRDGKTLQPDRLGRGASRTMAAKFRDVQARFGPGAVGVISTGQLVTEEFYALGKLVQLGLGTTQLRRQHHAVHGHGGAGLQALVRQRRPARHLRGSREGRRRHPDRRQHRREPPAPLLAAAVEPVDDAHRRRSARHQDRDDGRPAPADEAAVGPGARQRPDPRRHRAQPRQPRLRRARTPPGSTRSARRSRATRPSAWPRSPASRPR